MSHSNQPFDNNRVVVGVSGGVDSAVAAALLLEQGYEVIGVTLKLWKAPSAPARDAELPRLITGQLGIPQHVIDLQELFYREVVKPFMQVYAEGKTPNPCVFCNPGLKFQSLMDAAGLFGARWIATGHYARVDRRPDGAHLYRARGREKDQSYALYRLTQTESSRLLLPLGEVEGKEQVRAYAQARGLASAAAPDSQDLCFMGAGDYRELLEIHQIGSTPGPIYDISGKRLGSHQGLAHYTIGQRSGLGIAALAPLYVVRLDSAANAVIVGPREALEQPGCRVSQMTFISGQPPAEEFTAEGRIRYRAPAVPVSVVMEGATEARVEFEQPQRGVAPGQSLVLYRGDEVLGGGIIQ